jgi:glucose/arabinose dehydrogenase
LVLPAGFQADVFAEKVENARSMALGPQGTVFVGSQYVGKVQAVVDSDGDHKADRVVVIASGLDQPNGVAMRNGALYVATASRLLRFDDIEKHLDAPPAPVTVRDDLPQPEDGAHLEVHRLRTRRHAVHVSRGSVQRLSFAAHGVGHRADEARWLRHGGVRRRGAQQRRVRLAPGDARVVVHRQRPRPDGRRRAGRRAEHCAQGRSPLGFPYCHQGDVTDPEFGAQRAYSTTEPPVQKLGAHVAAIGFTFYTGNMFPAGYKNAAIIAQHGSWNRSTPSGYRVMVARTEGRRVTGYEPLIDGFLPGTGSGAGGRGAVKAAIGRPVDVLQMPDGSILISDDRGNRLIRVSYRR